jgi:methionine synthase II (cobalamin-independent)
MANEIPVYLFVGFLESGKTKFIQETFEDPNFDSGDKTLLLVCEEGEEEYNEKKFAFPGVTLYNLEDKAELNPQNLAKLADAGRVVIEYNGMWMLQDLANNLPENWIVYQCIATADGTTALTYARDNSMRALMLDKIPADHLWVNPDCGLKTRGETETVASLKNMVQAAKNIRNECKGDI